MQQTDRDRNILMPLNALLAANDRLEEAIKRTEKQWPHSANPCWIDQLNEPTVLLAKHRLKPCGTGGFGSGFVRSGAPISAFSAST